MSVVRPGQLIRSEIDYIHVLLSFWLFFFLFPLSCLLFTKQNQQKPNTTTEVLFPLPDDMYKVLYTPCWVRYRHAART